MTDQILLHSGSFDGLREAGSLGRPLHALYPSLKAAIASELGEEAALLLAEPAVDPARRQIDWYTWGKSTPESVLDRPESQRGFVYRKFIERYDQLTALAGYWAASGDVSRAQLGQSLAAALTPPSPSNLYWVDDRPVITYWGFSPEQRWGPPLDLPRLRAELGITGIADVGSVVDGPGIDGVPPPMPAHDLPESAHAPVSPPLPRSVTPPVDTVDKAPSEVKWVKLFVVVGSKFFWSVILVAGILAMASVFLHYAGWLSAEPTVAGDQTRMNDIAVLKQARSLEKELRARLDELLRKFKDKRLQCVPDPASGPGGRTSVVVPDSAGPRSTLSDSAVVPGPGDTRGVGARNGMVEQGSDAEPADVPPEKEAVEPGTMPSFSDESTPPVEAIPQPSRAETEEFNERVQQAGGTVGAVAVTLIWNNKNDLDLVVLCPTGERLYYNNPKACGGGLDVDKNAGKRLTDKPVENIRWPEGEAPAGEYQVAVKYYARKAGDQPPATPFQVRVLQNGKEILYKGTLMPDELKPVTIFTVER